MLSFIVALNTSRVIPSGSPVTWDHHATNQGAFSIDEDGLT